MKLSYDSLEERCQQLEEENQTLRKENAQLRLLLKQAIERIALLEERLGLDSKNSSKPPSSDNKSNTEKRAKGKRRSRKGKARSLYPLERVNQHVSCTCASCPHCGSTDLRELGSLPWQQVELPEIQANVTQFDRHKYRCGACGKRSLADLPKGVPFSAFGPRLMALISSLTGDFHMAKREAKQLIKDLYDIDVSLGSMINLEEHVGNALSESYERIHQFVLEGGFARHFDETSWRDRGQQHYIWIMTTRMAAFYRLDRHRSLSAFRKLIGQSTDPPSVSDRYGVYHILDGPHQYCLAHLIRDFHFFAARPGVDGEVGGKIEEELRHACRVHRRMERGEVTKRQGSSLLSDCRGRVDELFTEAMAFGSEKLHGLCQRLDEGIERVWAFTREEGLDPTNNLAERDLRPLVLWRKKSYGTRSLRGQRYVERVSSIVSTTKKQGIHVLRYLERAVENFYHKRPAPLISPSLGF